jgi:hypothetical protein
MGKVNEINYRGGVLIIGSLLWEDSKIRQEWRSQNLNMEEKLLINLPIRYGRISKSRSCTHSMIFSSECKMDDKMGKGYFIPFKDNLNIKQLIEQGKIFIDAEHNRITDLTRFNWGWGCLGITVNPNLQIEEANNLKLEWKKKFGKGFNPGQYRIGQEESIVSKEGVLKIEWQNELDEIDFVIGTATKPNIDSYPNARKIALKMLINDYDNYFKNNRRMSISTFQDLEVEAELNKGFE